MKLRKKNYIGKYFPIETFFMGKGVIIAGHLLAQVFFRKAQWRI